MRKILFVSITLAIIIFLFSALHVQAIDTSSLGLVDVTKAPFNADPKGKKDCTKSLQDAINFAQQNHKVAFFPSGIYKISNTIHCRQHSPPEEKRGMFKSGRGGTLLGSRKGDKPKIVLVQNSSGFDNKDKPKIAINLHQTFYEIDCIFNLQMISNISNLIHFKFIELKMTKRSPSKFSSEYNLYSTLIVLLLFPTLKICLYKFSELHSIKTGVSFSAIK